MCMLHMVLVLVSTVKDSKTKILNPTFPYFDSTERWIFRVLKWSNLGQSLEFLYQSKHDQHFCTMVVYKIEYL